MITDKEFDDLAQINHFIGGALAVILAGFLFGMPYFYAAGAAMGFYAAVKEFWYDEHYETTEVRGSSFKDFVFYVLGIIAGTAICIAKISFFHD